MRGAFQLPLLPGVPGEGHPLHTQRESGKAPGEATDRKTRPRRKAHPGADRRQGQELTYEVFFCPLVLVWYILTETGSIIENAGALGADIPPWLTGAIEALRSKVDETGEKSE